MKATLNNYRTGDVIREASENEIAASLAEVAAGRHEGVIEVEVDGVKTACYVEGAE